MRVDTARQYRTVLGVLTLLVAHGCGGGERDGSIPAAALTGFARLTGAVTAEPDPRSGRTEPAERIDGVELSPELSREVQGSGRELEASIRVVVAPDGTVLGTKVLDVRPADLELSARFAEELAQAVWGWRYRPATTDGAAVRTVVDLTFRTQGGSTPD